MHLRGLKEKDADYMLEWMHDPEIQSSFQVNMLSKTKQDVLGFIHSSSINVTDGQSVHFAITNDDDEYLGTISLKNINLTARNGEYAISIRKKAQGQGIAFAATKELLRRAFIEYHLEKVYLNVLSDNIKAINLYKKCGFVYEGEFRKHLLLEGNFKSLYWYSILREEYVSEQ